MSTVEYELIRDGDGYHQKQALATLTELGYTPEMMADNGMTEDGYWQFRVDAEGKKIIERNRVARFWREWRSPEHWKSLRKNLLPYTPKEETE